MIKHFAEQAGIHKKVWTYNYGSYSCYNTKPSRLGRSFLQHVAKSHITLKQNRRNPRFGPICSENAAADNLACESPPGPARCKDPGKIVRRRERLQRGGPESFRDWRRGESNPCPRRFPRKHLHAYPALRFKEPTLHRRTTSSRASAKFDSPLGAVAPPIGQPAVHASGASRRRPENVAVN